LNFYGVVFRPFFFLICACEKIFLRDFFSAKKPFLRPLCVGVEEKKGEAAAAGSKVLEVLSVYNNPSRE
jgi:hypothetical protein